MITSPILNTWREVEYSNDRGKKIKIERERERERELIREKENKRRRSRIRMITSRFFFCERRI